MEEHITSSGVAIPLRHVSKSYISRVFKQYDIPDPPTYTAELVGGATQTFIHDETTLVSLDDEREWNAYLKARADAVSERLERVAEFLLYNCVTLDPPPVEEWMVDFDFWGFEKPDPEDKKKFKQAWIEHELLADPDDHAAVMAKLYAMGGIIDDGRVKEFEKFFRSELGRLASS